MPEWRKIFEAEDSDFGGWCPGTSKCVHPLKWVYQVPHFWERETTDPKQTTINPSPGTASGCAGLFICQELFSWGAGARLSLRATY